MKVRFGNGKKLQNLNEPLPDTEIVEDEYIQEIAQSGQAQVFMTDVAAAAIMCSQKANYSWDVVIKKFRDFIFIDKRREENMLHNDTVSETAPNDQQPMDDDTDNGVRQLMKEAGKIYANILWAAQNSKKFTKLERDDPHEEIEDQKMLRMGYKYNLFKISSDPDVTICIRCAINFHDPGSKETANLFVLPQWNIKKQTWQRDLDANTTIMLTKEITDNACKFSRWTM